jgi:nucleotide-binding universal stress UspA family protein
MYKKILIATDGSPLAGKAVEHGLALAKELKSEVVAVTVKEPLFAPLDGSELGGAYAIESYESDCKKSAEKVLEKVAAKAHELDVPCTTVYIRDQGPSEGII